MDERLQAALSSLEQIPVPQNFYDKAAVFERVICEWLRESPIQSIRCWFSGGHDEGTVDAIELITADGPVRENRLPPSSQSKLRALMHYVIARGYGSFNGPFSVEATATLTPDGKVRFDGDETFERFVLVDCKPLTDYVSPAEYEQIIDLMLNACAWSVLAHRSICGDVYDSVCVNPPTARSACLEQQFKHVLNQIDDAIYDRMMEFKSTEIEVAVMLGDSGGVQQASVTISGETVVESPVGLEFELDSGIEDRSSP